MPARARADLARRAHEVLERNRRGEWTCPSSELYPHQWLWDSCFVAIGLAHSDPQRAAGELRSLFRGQWANGMLPHMIFAPGVHDFGSRRIWRSKKHPHGPQGCETSSITQPPLAAIAAWRVARALPAGERRAFLADLFPRLVAYHSWLYRARDLHGRGLVTLIHPWECGLDTTPPWMQALSRMWIPWWLRIVLRLHLARLARVVRRDTRFVPAAERTSDDDGLRMLVLAHRARRYGFDLRHLPSRGSVLIEDLAFNALLVVANQALAQIAGELDTALDPHLQQRSRLTVAALDELWDDRAGRYCSRDVLTGELIGGATVATFVPLWTGVPSRARAERLVSQLRSGSGFWPPFPVPSVPTDAAEFDAERYWKGPTWVNTNWAIIEGLGVYGETELADELEQRTLDLVEHGGCFEYFSPITGRGFGAPDFSWTAALVLDLLDAPRTA